MSKALINFLCVGLAISFSHAHAGGDGGSHVGNGGLGISCNGAGIRFLDSFVPVQHPLPWKNTSPTSLLRRPTQDMTLSQNADGERIEKRQAATQQVSTWLDRLAQSDPAVAQMMHEWLVRFWDESEIIWGPDAPITNDWGIEIPEGCHLVQIAVQKTPLSDQGARYKLYGQNLDLLSTLDLADLIHHELWLRFALEYNDRIKDTSTVRILSRWVSSQDILLTHPSETAWLIWGTKTH